MPEEEPDTEEASRDAQDLVVAEGGGGCCVALSSQFNRYVFCSCHACVGLLFHLSCHATFALNIKNL